MKLHVIFPSIALESLICDSFFYDCKCGVILTCCLLTSEDHKGQYLLARSDFVSQITKLTIDIPIILAELISLEKMKAS